MPIVRDLKKRDSRKVLVLEDAGSKKEKVQHVSDIARRSISDIKNKNKKPEYIIAGSADDSGAKDKRIYRRNIFSFAAAGILVVFVFNIFSITNQLFYISGAVEADAYTGYEMFLRGGANAKDSNFGGAVQSFEAANKAFNDARNKLWFLSDNNIIPRHGAGLSAYMIIESAALIADAASYFSQAVSELNEVPILFVQHNTQHAPENKISLTGKLKSSLELFNQAFDKILSARNKLAQADTMLIPDKFRSHFAFINATLDELVAVISEIQTRIPAILKLLGDRYPHRYLVLLQNNTESRPTGGFIGSFLIIDVNDGYIEKSVFYDIYEHDGQLHEDIPPPDEMAELTQNWRMRDSNYSPDFAISAQKAAWFLEKSKGPGVDSVIAINQSMLKDFFSITGPVEVEGLFAPLTGENFNTVITYIVESKLEGASDPKAVLDRFIPMLQQKLYDKASFKNLFTVIQKGIREKQIMAWSKYEDVQYLFDEIGISGVIKRTEKDEDYLNLTVINIGGNKSDLYIEPEIIHETVIKKNGEVLNRLTYTRKHTWTPEILNQWSSQLAPFGYKDIPDWLQDILGKGLNKAVVKVFLPHGITVEDIAGIEKNELKSGYDEKLNKSFIYFTMEVSPGNEKVVSILYKLPHKLNLSAAGAYRLTVQKQPGAIVNSVFIKRITSDAGVENLRNYPEEVIYEEGKILEYNTTLATDQYFASLWGRE